MAIRINAGAAPSYGRLTMPKGTFLNSPQQAFSNPATSAAGGLGAGGGTQPAQAGQIGLFDDQPPTDGGATLTERTWQQSFWNPNSLSDFGRGISGWWNSLPGSQPKAYTQVFYNAAGVPIQGYEHKAIWNGKEEVTYNPVAYDYRGNRYAWDPSKKEYVRDETGALSQTPLQKTPNSPSNDLVGNDLGTAPSSMTASQVLQMFPNLTPAQVAEVMRSKGYEPKYLPGVGGLWVKSTTATPSATANGLTPGGGATSSEVDARGRPTWVDPTQLARGERVTAASGLTFVGGAKTAEGKSQYAVTVPQSRAVAEDKHGKYKWESYTKKDEEGNWVRVYYKKLRKVYSKRAQRRRAEARQQAAPTPAPQPPAPPEMNDAEALVTLRANFG